MANTLISQEHHEHWMKHGYVVVRLIDDDQLKAVLDNVYDYFPSWEESQPSSTR
jgi:hypothetical protein